MYILMAPRTDVIVHFVIWLWQISLVVVEGVWWYVGKVAIGIRELFHVLRPILQSTSIHYGEDQQIRLIYTFISLPLITLFSPRTHIHSFLESSKLNPIPFL